jgi:hypothetical protein
MNRSLVFAALLMLSSALHAAGFTVTPTSGPAAGGTTVTIKGDFGDWPYGVSFDGTPAVSTTKVDAHTLVAVTPPHLPGPTRVLVFEYDLFLDTGVTFTFTGEVPQAFERILVPLLTPPVKGAFGSEFHTELTAHNASGQAVHIYGIRPFCVIGICEQRLHSIPYVVNPGSGLESYESSGTPGRFLYVPAGQARDLALNLRVHDVTRSALNFGTEIPVVHAHEVTNDRITLLGVPTDPRFRNTLRIYGTHVAFLSVSFTDGEETFHRSVVLSESPDIFVPEYASISDFPVFASGAATMRVTIEGPPPVLPVFSGPFWAFISVTNNDTQVITTITPQR